MEKSEKTINFILDTSLLSELLQKICITFVIQMIVIFKSRMRKENSKQIKLFENHWKAGWGWTSAMESFFFL